MRELGEKRAAVQLFVAVPTPRLVIAFVPIPVAIQLHHVNLPQLAGIHHILNPNRRRRIPVLHHTERLTVVAQRGEDNLLGIRFRQSHRLFNHDMMPRLHAADSHRRM